MLDWLTPIIIKHTHLPSKEHDLIYNWHVKHSSHEKLATVHAKADTPFYVDVVAWLVKCSSMHLSLLKTYNY